ncbi:AAA domain-containing protein [Rostrohypoxylon terebratum]|nr:AAA domain-containing protein [Rostrohypoxylon terebratum]
MTVVRAYKPVDEISAVKYLLENPNVGDAAIIQKQPLSTSKWKLELSLASWVLVSQTNNLTTPTIREAEEARPITVVNTDQYDLGDPALINQINQITMASHIEEEGKDAYITIAFLMDLVRTTDIKASQTIVLSPYAGNVDLLRRLLKRDRYVTSLAGIGEPSTIDGYQGQERQIVVVVMGTDRGIGPGFTADRQRLNVLLTRQKCGLVIVGDIAVAGPLRDEPAHHGQAPAPGRDFSSLRAVLLALYKQGQFAFVDALEKMEASEKLNNAL